MLCAQAEIDRRFANIGDDYPFRIDAKGRALQFVTPVSNVGSVYLFCLFLSHAADHTIVPKAFAPDVTNKVRDLFRHAPPSPRVATSMVLQCHSAFRGRTARMF